MIEAMTTNLNVVTISIGIVLIKSIDINFSFIFKLTLIFCFLRCSYLLGYIPLNLNSSFIKALYPENVMLRSKV